MEQQSEYSQRKAAKRRSRTEAQKQRKQEKLSREYDRIMEQRGWEYLRRLKKQSSKEEQTTPLLPPLGLDFSSVPVKQVPDRTTCETDWNNGWVRASGLLEFSIGFWESKRSG